MADRRVITLDVVGEERAFGFDELWLPPGGVECGKCDYVFKPSKKAHVPKSQYVNAQPLHYCEPVASDLIEFFSGLRLVDGDFIGEEFRLVDWCLDAIHVVFAMMMWDSTAREPGFYRLIQELFGCITRGGMKSAWLSGLICNFLATAAVGKEGIFAQQTMEEAQSKMVKHVQKMIEISPVMSHFNEDDAWVGKTVKKGGGNRFRRGEGEGDVNMRLASPLNFGKSRGYRYSFGVFDEVGFMLDHQAEGLIEDVAKYSNTSPDPLWLVFSTLAKISTHYQRRRYVYALEVNRDPTINPRFWSYLYTAPMTEKPSVELAVRNCPLYRLEILPRSNLQTEFDASEKNAALLSKYGTERCGIAGDFSVKFMRHDYWEACRVEGGKPEILKRMAGLDKYIGLDFSETRDLSAMTIVAWEADGTQLVCPYHWVPDSAMHQLEAITQGQAAYWLLDGGLEQLPAGEAFPELVAKRALAKVAHFDPAEIVSWGYDPNSATAASTVIRKAGWNQDPKGVQVIKQGKGLNAAILEAQGAAEHGKIAQPGDAVFDYCVLCAQTEPDQKNPDLIQLVKPERGTSTDRIDGAAAWATAVQTKIAYELYLNMKAPAKTWEQEALNPAI